MTQDRTENSRAWPMRHHGFKRARRVSDTYKMCDCFILSCSKNVLIYRNIHFSKIYPHIVKLQQKFTLFWIFPRRHIAKNCFQTFWGSLETLGISFRESLTGFGESGTQYPASGKTLIHATI